MGWKEHEKKHIPVATDFDVASADIKRAVFCKCSSDTRKPCGTQACMCLKFGLSCVSACKNCNGISCENASDSSLDHTANNKDLDGDDIVEEVYVTFLMRNMWSFSCHGTSRRKL
jgi:hypothetical protein